MRKILFLIIASALLMGCGSSKTATQAGVYPELSRRDTLYLNKVQYDSIYHSDSFLMDYHPSKDYIYLFDSVLVMKIDTMYIRDKNVEYKYKFLHDTTYIHKVDTIPVIQQVEVVKTETYVPPIYKWSLGIVITLIVLLVLYLLVKYRKLFLP